MMKQSYSEDKRFANLPENRIKLQNFKKEYLRLSEFDCPYTVKALAAGGAMPIEDYYSNTKMVRQANEKYWQSDFSFLKKQQPPKLVALLGLNCTIDLGILLGINLDKERPFEVLLVEQLQQDFTSAGHKRRIRFDYDGEFKIDLKSIKNRNNYSFFIQEIKLSEVLEIFVEKITLN